MKESVIRSEGDTLEVQITCEIDHHTAKIIREEVDRELFVKRSKTLIFDFSRVTFMDSSGIGLIIGRAAKAEALGGKVVIVGLSPALRRLVRMSGMEKLKHITVK